jgi:NAD(P)-dependent dehydrogenase (short-subunit alcohol dehydrogenase family)
MISELSKKVSKIDVLINNAGVFKSSIPSNQDGLDLRFSVNYFAPYLLTNGLLPILKNSDSPRVINLSSAAQSTVSIEALKGKEAISSQGAYAQSKLALTMWSFAFAKANPEITTIAVNPGSLLNTNMVKEAYGQFWSSADKGADILYELAVSEKHTESNGKYLDNDKGAFSNAHSDAYNQEQINQLIAETNKILNS